MPAGHIAVVMDGGVEGGATEQPYSDDPTHSGRLNWELERMAELCTATVRRGWRIGTDAARDRAVRTVLDVYEQVIKRQDHWSRARW